MLQNAVFCDDILKKPSASGGVAPRPLPGALPLDPTGGLLRPPDPRIIFILFHFFPVPCLTTVSWPLFVFFPVFMAYTVGPSDDVTHHWCALHIAFPFFSLSFTLLVLALFVCLFVFFFFFCIPQAFVLFVFFVSCFVFWFGFVLGLLGVFLVYWGVCVWFLFVLFCSLPFSSFYVKWNKWESDSVKVVWRKMFLW